jgi:Flp pilus assembly protein TadD
MKTVRPIVFSQLILLLCLVLCTLGTMGCAQPTGSGSIINSGDKNPELAFENVRDLQPTAKTLYAISEILAEQGKDSESQVVLKQILRDHPGFVPAYNSLAELLMRNGRTREAVAVMLEGLRIHPRDPVLLNNAGMCWIMRREYDKALDMFTQAAGRMPENARYRANMAVALGLMGRDEESLALFKQILPEEQAKHNLNILCPPGKISKAGSGKKNSG